MAKLKPMKRGALNQAIEARRDDLVKNAVMITSFRPTRDNTVQVEICQPRLLAGKKQTLLGVLNRGNSKFADSVTLLYDWLTLNPEAFVKAFPEVDVTKEQLEEIAAKWSANDPVGKEATVYALLTPVTKVRSNGEDLTPVIIVTEVTHSELTNGEFFTGEKADEKAQNVIENGNAVMRTGSGDDAEYLVHPETGDRIYRFTRTEFAENNPKDTIIAGKVTESHFKKMNSGATRANKGVTLNSILDDADSI